MLSNYRCPYITYTLLMLLPLTDNRSESGSGSESYILIYGHVVYLHILISSPSNDPDAFKLSAPLHNIHLTDVAAAHRQQARVIVIHPHIWSCSVSSFPLLRLTLMLSNYRCPYTHPLKVSTHRPLTTHPLPTRLPLTNNRYPAFLWPTNASCHTQCSLSIHCFNR